MTDYHFIHGTWYIEQDGELRQLSYTEIIEGGFICGCE